MTSEKTVLLVDDDHLVLEAMSLLLTTLGGFSAVSGVGSEGAARLMLELLDVDILIVDILLAGGTDGLALGRQAIERYPAIAVVVITADSEDYRDEMPEFGVFLRKPFDGAQLLASMDAANKLAKLRMFAGSLEHD